MANFINLLALLLTLLIIVYILSTWVFPPYNDFRRAISSIVEPMLTPIRRLIPPVGMFDFSALIFLILVQVLANILTGVLR
ncbi:MAG: YggT family protein [Anaerolineales bacterium]|jgi:YggT family protein